MDFSINATVHCTDGDTGHVTCVIINPVTDDITHLIVSDAKFLGVERMVPISVVVNTSENKVVLNCDKKQLQKYDEFIGVDYDFLEKELPYMYDTVAYWPLAEPGDGAAYESAWRMARYEKIPPGELAIRRGAAVLATDGQIGHVHEFLADPKTGHISHLILTRGHLWGKRNISIPINEIDNFDEFRVTLKIDKEAVGNLPEFAIKH